MDDVHPLLDAYLENDLTDRDSEALCAWLRESDGHVDRFVRDSFLHWQLLAVLGQQSLHADVMAAPAALAPRVSDAMSLGRLPSTQRASWRLRAGWLPAIAASLLVAAAVGYFAFRSPSIAQLTGTTALVRWEQPQDAPRVGALLKAGQTLRLREGRVLATLVSGARLVIEGPAEVRIDGEDRLWLQSGRLGVEVPAQATGLVVDSPFGEFVDMGTEFTINLDLSTGCQIHVFTGMVELRPSEHPGPPVVVSLGSAISYESATGDVKFLPFDEGQKLSL